MHKLSHCLHSLLINHSFIQKQTSGGPALGSSGVDETLDHVDNQAKLSRLCMTPARRLKSNKCPWIISSPPCRCFVPQDISGASQQQQQKKSCSILLKGWSRWRLTFSFRGFLKVPIFCHFVVKLHECLVEKRIAAFSVLGVLNFCVMCLFASQGKSYLLSFAETHLTSKEVSADLHYNLVVLVRRLVPGHHHFCTGQVLQLVYLQSQRETPK